MSTGSNQPFTPSGTVAIAAGTSSASVPLPPGGDTVLVYNATAAAAFVAFGGAAATAVAGASLPVPPGGSRLIYVGRSAATVAAVLSAGTGTVYVSAGTGTVY